ncbi:hypothetical protein [Pseudoduganella albidiflava]|nr:hypothetical protein [Pseudoduganella albidiflava]QBI03771.1 hypothetical protein EYF70_25340 [Pseudoduganella albidiflava]
MAEKRIFRQAALDRLASPEQLDHLVPVADAPGWIALSIGALLALALLAWGLAGSLPITLAACGSLAADGHAVLRVPAAAAGAVRPGMDVLLRPAPLARGAVIASRGKVARVATASGGALAVADSRVVHVTLPPSGYPAGTSVEADIVLSRQRPIALLVPAWK